MTPAGKELHADKSPDNTPDGWNDRISSLDTRGHACIIYDNFGCDGDRSVEFAGVFNAGFLNDRISSFRCR